MAFTPQIALDFFRSARERNRLAHAYLITGAEGSGKRRLAADVVELVNGAPKDGAYMLNGGDVGLLGSLDKLSAQAASALTPTGSSIAAHVDHLRYGLSLMNR